jgi:hypothetical protein
MDVYLLRVRILHAGRASDHLRHGSCLVHGYDGPGDVSSLNIRVCLVPFVKPNPNPLLDQ